MTPGLRHCVELVATGWRCGDCGALFDAWPDDSQTCPGDRRITEIRVRADEWLARFKCCQSPSMCGAHCQDDEVAHYLAHLADDVPWLLDVVRSVRPIRLGDVG